MKFREIIFFASLFYLASAVPKFSDTYSVSGSLHIPYAEVKEPFYAYFDSEAGSSRIDYYGGMAKTYQLTKYGQYGSQMKVVPVTTEKELNVDTCLKIDGDELHSIEIQSILPDLTGFEKVDTELIHNVETEKWRLVVTQEEKVNKYTMWVQYKKLHPKTTSEEAVPVMYEMRGYNTLLGSHYDHYYLRYDSYSSEKPAPQVFDVEANLTCQGFPGPGNKHIYSFNPMKEFIHNMDTHVDSAFEEFVQVHNKAYDSTVEHLKRKELFRQNMRLIHSHNRANKGFRLGVNHLADRTDQELEVLRGRRYSKGYNGGLPFTYSRLDLDAVPEYIDWRLNGAVTPVKDQSVCGSCWSYGTTGTIEGAYFMKTGKLVRLSQQVLIDCTWGFGNNGCDGGEDYRAYRWILKHGGLPLEDDYGAYLAQDGYCHYNNVNLTAPITGYVNVTSGDIDGLKVALATKGPISVSIDASQKTFAFYSNGVYYDEYCGNTPEALDHSVLLVGYGVLNGEPYWLIKNSWSTYWGNDGYILMSPKNNNCGVATAPTYVTM